MYWPRCELIVEICGIYRKSLVVFNWRNFKLIIIFGNCLNGWNSRVWRERYLHFRKKNWNLRFDNSYDQRWGSKWSKSNFNNFNNL